MENCYICSLCERSVPSTYIEKHHLIPRCKNGKGTVSLCIDCGNQVHLLFSIKELEKTYNTLEALKNNEKVQKWIKWIQKKNDFGVCAKIKKKRS
jgi:5-methylcytosine-specific restriction protein A